MKIAQQIKQQLDAKREEAKTAWQVFADSREEAVKSGVDFSKDADAFKELHEKNATYSALADEVAELEDRFAKALDLDGDAPPEPKSDETTERAAKSGIWTPGLRLVQNEVYKDLAERGQLTKQQGVELPAVEVANREEFKALITGASDTSAGAFVQVDRVGYYPGLLQPLDVLNMITVGETDSDLVEYVKENSFTNAAAEIAEATDTAGTGAKPESALDFAIIQQAVKTIAHWIPATKRALSDAGQLRTIVDQRLEDGVRLRLQAQVVNGNGAGENLRGILNTSGIGTVDASDVDPGAPVVAVDPMEAILYAITAIRLAFIEPTGVGLHPADWRDMRLARDESGGAGTGQYLLGPPNVAGPEQLWGVPVHQSAVYPSGTGLVGKFDEAILWVREGVTVSASDSHADFFTHNLVAILAEGRFAFGVPRPAAFCKVLNI
jgi:HK97 family phage major capsid protein